MSFLFVSFLQETVNKLGNMQFFKFMNFPEDYKKQTEALFKKNKTTVSLFGCSHKYIITVGYPLV